MILVHTLHERLQFTALVVMLILAAWGVINFARNRGVTPNYRGSLIFGTAIMVVESLLGLILLLGGSMPARPAVHFLYGAIAVLTLPLTAAYLRGRTGRWSPLIYALMCLFLAGIALRAQLTAIGM